MTSITKQDKEELKHKVMIFTSRKELMPLSVFIDIIDALPEKEEPPSSFVELKCSGCRFGAEIKKVYGHCKHHDECVRHRGRKDFYQR